VKGETEESIAACGYPSLTIVRPDVIGGDRDESRPAEFAAMQILRLIGPLLPRGFRLSPAPHIARALLEAGVTATPGRRVMTAEALA
jgi:hypothetical protein